MDFKGALNKASLRHGSYSAVITVIVLALVILANMFVKQLPAQYIYYDMSDEKLYSVGETTKKFVEGLNEDVTIYLILDEKSEDRTLEQLLITYDGLSSHIKTGILDPNKDYKKLKDFGFDTTVDTVKNGSVIVESARRFKFIDADSIYELDLMSYQQYKVELYDFDGEGEITSAISFVTSTDLPVMGIVEGHEEVEVGTSVYDLITKANFDMKRINLLNTDIPEKCDVLLLNAPMKDYSDEETGKIKDYIDKGGKLMITSVYSSNNLKNFMSVLEYAGVTFQEGVLFEGSGMYMTYPYNMVVSANGGHTIMSSFKTSDLALVLYGQGILKSENARKDIVISPLLSTTKNSFSRIDLSSTSVSKTDKDVSGPFDVAVAVEDTESGMKAVVYSTPLFVADSVIAAYPAAVNTSVFMNSLSWMCSFSQDISIAAKSTNYPTNVYTDAQGQLFLIVTVIALPVLVLVVGLFVWYRRRTR